MFKDFTLIQEVKLVGMKRGFFAILNFAKENPLLLYQIVVFFKYLSLPSLGLIIVGLIANHLFLNILLMVNISVIRYKTIHGALNQFGNCVYKTCRFKNFLDMSNAYKDIYKDIVDNLFLRPFAILGIKDIKLDDIIKIHVVVIEDSIVSKATAYEIPFFESHIFVGNFPEEVKGFTRFQVLHEIGHCLMKLATYNHSVIAGVKTYIFFCVWALLTVAWDFNSLSLIAVLMTFLFLLKEEIGEQHKLLVLREEMIADSFALSFLSKDDLKKLATKPIDACLDDIKRLGVIYNKIRLTCLKENILLAIDGKEDTVLEHMKAVVPDKLYIFVYPFMLSGLIAVYSIAPSYKMLLGFFVFTLVLLIIYIFSFMLSDSLRAIINSRIKEQQVKMTKQDLITEVLEKYFEEESDMVSFSTLKKIANGVTKITQTHGGSEMDSTGAVTLLFTLVGFINDVISLGKLLKDKQDVQQNALQLKESAESSELFNSLPSEIRMRIGNDIYVYVLEKIQKGEVEP